MLQLYTYYRSVAAHRVRIGLNYKGIPYQSIFIDLERTDNLSDDYLRLNPQGLVPALVEEDGLVITQSAAILEYLEEKYPQRALLPDTTEARARVRSFVQAATADMHPLNTIRVYRYLRDDLDIDYDRRREWFHHWGHVGFRALESLLAEHPDTGSFCHGERPTLMDVILVPQVYNAEQYGLDLSPYPTVRRIYRTCLTLAAFQGAGPDVQPDLMAKTAQE